MSRECWRCPVLTPLPSVLLERQEGSAPVQKALLHQKHLIYRLCWRKEFENLKWFYCIRVSRAEQSFSAIWWDFESQSVHTWHNHLRENEEFSSFQPNFFFVDAPFEGLKWLSAISWGAWIQMVCWWGTFLIYIFRVVHWSFSTKAGITAAELYERAQPQRSVHHSYQHSFWGIQEIISLHCRNRYSQQRGHDRMPASAAQYLGGEDF